MTNPPPEEPPSLVPVHDEMTGRVVGHYDPATKLLRVKAWRVRRKWVRVWVDIRALLDTQEAAAIKCQERP